VSRSGSRVMVAVAGMAVLGMTATLAGAGTSIGTSTSGARPLRQQVLHDGWDHGADT
jgi:hypothetical protein